MLDKFAQNVGPERMAVPEARGLSFYQVLTLASIVEREALLDEEKPLIAGVYQNRLDPKKWPHRLLQSDPTVFYVHDTLELAKLAVEDWPTYVFWAPIKGGLTDETLPPELAGYNTYKSTGLPPGPIATPTPGLDRRRARAGHQGRLPLLPGQGRRQRRRRRSPRRSRSTRPTSRST